MSDDVNAIKNLINSYAELLDTGEFVQLGALFERATVLTHARAEPLQGAEAMQQLMETAVHLYDGITATKHVISNLIVEVDNDRQSAIARSYYTALGFGHE